MSPLVPRLRNPLRRLFVSAALALAVVSAGCHKSEDEAKKPDEAAAAPDQAAAAASGAAPAAKDETPAPTEPAAQVEVPDFTSKLLNEAMKDAVRVGLVAQIGDAKRADQAAPGSVVGQKPAKGEKVEKLSTVVLIPREDPPPPVEMLDIPAVTGKSLKEAQEILFDHGFTPQVGRAKFTGKAPGTILDQNPDAHKKAPKGSTVQLIPEKQSVVVPDLHGMPIVDAILKLRRLELDWNGGAEMTTRLAAGGILEQSPKAGTRAEEGSAIKLTVAKAAPGAVGSPKWCSDFDDIKHLGSKDIAEMTALLGHVMPRNYVSAVQLEPRSPAQRWSGEHVAVSFGYATEHGKDALVMVMPYAHGKEVAGGSDLKFRTQPDGQDTFKGSFTVYTQTPVVVDELRVIMYDLRSGHYFQKLYEAKIPVQIRFTPTR
ncbi:MAG: PASTA domain-containing protein [Planctomycetaceae bacterium]|nr:PASTA domain-containing protein [Planctomycetaceae bacterium]